MKLMNWKLILLAGTLSALAGCQTTMPAKPPKPTLDVIESEGMVCFSREDSISLGRYIINLEAGYD